MSIAPYTGLESYNVKLTSYKGTGPMLRRGVRGDPVAALQTMLNSTGAGIRVDGVFGPGTEDAVLNFQRSAGLATDGIVGTLTWNALAQALGRNITVTGAITSTDTGEKIETPSTTSSGFSVGVALAVAAVLVGGTLLLGSDS